MLESVNDFTGSPDLLSAEQLRAMTISQEDLFLRRKNEILNSLMESMKSAAVQNGLMQYSATLHPLFDKTLLQEITDTLKNLGYIVVATPQKQEKVGEVIVLAISWVEDLTKKEQ